jgi:hypothetical protein
MNVNEFLQHTAELYELQEYFYQKVRPLAVCADGTTLSIQASEVHYCAPRCNSDGTDSYVQVEVWRVSKEVPEDWNEYGDTENNPYAYIPVELVDSFVESCGGIVRCLK